MRTDTACVAKSSNYCHGNLQNTIGYELAYNGKPEARALLNDSDIILSSLRLLDRTPHQAYPVELVRRKRPGLWSSFAFGEDFADGFGSSVPSRAFLDVADCRDGYGTAGKDVATSQISKLRLAYMQSSVIVGLKLYCRLVVEFLNLV